MPARHAAEACNRRRRSISFSGNSCPFVPGLRRTEPGTGLIISSLPEAVLTVFADRREQVVDDAALAGLDLGGDGHAGCEIDALVLHLHGGPFERDASGIDRTLVVARRLGRRCGVLLAL